MVSVCNIHLHIAYNSHSQYEVIFQEYNVKIAHQLRDAHKFMSRIPQVGFVYHYHSFLCSCACVPRLRLSTEIMMSTVQEVRKQQSLNSIPTAIEDVANISVISQMTDCR